MTDIKKSEPVDERVRALLEQIIVPIHRQGGTGEEVMILLESLCAGTILALARIYPHLTGSETALAGAFADRVSVRVAMALARDDDQ